MIELEFADAFQARHLATPMSQAFSVALQDDAAEAAKELRARRYDQAPVLDGERILGFVMTPHLTRPPIRSVADAMMPLGSGNVVSADASIGRLMEWILDPGFLFVLEGRDSQASLPRLISTSSRSEVTCTSSLRGWRLASRS